MLVASLAFASMAVCVKFASAWFNSAELVFWRGLIGMVLMWLWARSTAASRSPRATPACTPGAAWWAWCRWAPGSTPSPGLPLATAMTLNYMSSVWIAAFLVGGALLAWNPRAGAPVPAGQGGLALTVLAASRACC
jgi:hypothetical protein